MLIGFNFFLQLQGREEALVNFKGDLAVLEREIQVSI